ncbi:transporter, CPA2 family (TC 2.A.37) [Maridesulfovibrio ferrireducens]|uniref:Transporter, CPA2 family (TC 2.A.37) n=1 Tax=Maridesulfovibrio ferrireducens TaxID=246191 RepID=A0A1G9FZX7_9BACT|nr:cation:proton antiporter [Maridesulfovibrio ferrireducens]SDK93942.1 transporter, CPA2 family (TC 2.A.37) [Maridesulfovibrio ferrireducens]
MVSSALSLITLGLLFLVGLVADFIGRRTPLPRVSALLVFGFCIGPSGFDVLPVTTNHWMPLVSDMALAMIGFLLGNSLKFSEIKESGRAVISISIAVVVITAVMVSFGLWMVGIPLQLALLYGGLAPATDPASTADVINESKAKGRFTKTLLGITAIDDAWGLILFSFMLAAAQMIMLGGGSMNILMTGGRDLFLAILVGVTLGVPMSFLTGRIQRGEPTLVEALGMVFICSGVALWLDVSFLLSSMTMGAVVANLAKHHTRPFSAIEGVEWPVIVLFFIFAGVSIELKDISANALVIVAYIFLRIVSRIIGVILGAGVAGEGKTFGRWMGLALMPQAGVALGMALAAAHRFSQFESIVTVVATATVFFEIAGPICTRIALNKVGDIPGSVHRRI